MAFGGSSTPGPGLVALGVAGVVGLMSIVPALKVALSAEGRPVHPLLALGGLVGSGLYLYGLLQPVVASGQPLWTGDVWTDASLALLIAALAGGGLIVGLRRTGAACGFLGGVMLFPAATWLAELGDEPSAFETTQTLGRTETAVGLALAMAVAVIGTFTAATKAQSGPSGVARVPAHSNGALTAALSVVAIVALAGLAAEDSGDGSDVYTDESDFFGDDSSDGFSDDFSDDGGSWVDDDSTWTEDDPGFGDDFGEDDFGEDDFFGDDYDDYGGDGCPPPDYDCVDDDFFGD